jgi:hypothetical protein
MCTRLWQPHGIVVLLLGRHGGASIASRIGLVHGPLRRYGSAYTYVDTKRASSITLHCSRADRASIAARTHALLHFSKNACAQTTGADPHVHRRTAPADDDLVRAACACAMSLVACARAYSCSPYDRCQWQCAREEGIRA